MAVVLNQLLSLRKELMEIVVKPAETFTTFEQDISEIFKEIKGLVSDWSKSDYPSYKVAKSFLEKDEDGGYTISKGESLWVIHTAIYNIQEINTKISIDLYDKAVEIHSLAKSLHNSLKVELQNNEKLLMLISTKTDQAREVDFIMNNTNLHWSTIDMRFKQIKNLVNYMEDQSSALNRLDSALRLKQSIDSTAAFEAISTSNTIEIE